MDKKITAFKLALVLCFLSALGAYSDQYVIDEFIAAQKNKLAQIQCGDGAENQPACANVETQFNPVSLFNEKAVDSGQTILVIDDEGIELPAVLRYRSRVKNIYELKVSGSSVGQLRQYNPRVTLPKYVTDVLLEINNLKKLDASGTQIPVFVPALATRDLSEEIYKKDSTIASQYRAYHGDMPLLYLMDKNPRAAFMLIRQPKIHEAFKSEFCENNLGGFKERVSVLSDQLKSIMLVNKVTYVSWSGGHTLETVLEQWDLHCVGKVKPSESDLREMLLALKPFFDVLFNSNGIMGFQATATNMSEFTHPLDTTAEFKNRMRIGPYATLDSGLPEDGVIGWREPPVLADGYRSSRQWVDMFANMGVIFTRPFPFNQTPLMELDILGLDAYPISHSAPSWVTPVATSQAIYIKNKYFADAPMTNELIKSIREKMTPVGCYANASTDGDVCKVQDPLLYRKQELFRLGYE